MLNPNNITAVYLGWDKPIIWSLVDWLKSQSSSFDYSEFILIVPSKRAQSRISELLVLDANSKKRGIIAPKFYSSISSCLNDHLSTKDKSPISITESLIAWEECISQYKEIEDSTNLIPAEHLGTYLEKLRKDLLSYNLKISDILEKAQEFLSDPQIQLCEQLSILDEIYEDTLNKYGFYDNHNEVEFTPPPLKYVLVGFHAVSPLEAGLIDKFNLDTYNIIGAPNSEVESFLDDGSLNSTIWEKMVSPIHIHVVANPFIEIESINEILTKSDTKDLSLSILEETLIGPLQASLISNDLNALPLGSKPFTNSLWGSWLLALIGLNIEGTENVRTFFEHPLTTKAIDLGNIANNSLDILALLDRLLNYSALEVESLDDLFHILGTEQSILLKDLLKCTLPKLDNKGTLGQYSSELIERLPHFLNTLDSIEEEGEILTLVKELSDLNESPLKDHILELKTFHKILRDRFINIDSTFQVEDSIPIIGWQETYLDDASNIIVSDCIEGKLPSYPPQDPIITEQIRTTLGMPVRSYYNARDMFILYYLVNSKEKTLFIAPQESTSGDQNKLSKLVLSGLNDKRFIKTLNTFYGAKSSSQTNFKQNKLNKPKPLPSPPTGPYKEFPLESKTLSATQIRDYITCPYSFYLRHILKMNLHNYQLEELPPNILGNILHDVFSKVGRQIINNVPGSKKELLTFANHELDKLIYPYLKNEEKGQIFALQHSYLKTKLEAYVEFESQSLEEQPHKILTELNAKNFLGLNLPNGETIEVVGRIDRIEILADRCKIIDFKTGDTPLKFSKCLKNEIWLDPQLPLYGLYAKASIPEADGKIIELHLINFSKTQESTHETHLLSSQDLDSAISISEAVAIAILNAEFEPTQNVNPRLLRRLAGDIGGLF